MRIVVGIYTRAPHSDLQRFLDKPSLLRRLDPRVAIADGRALDLGRRWEELGCLLDGGISPPRSGPTVGDTVIASSDDVVWSVVEPERVEALAEELGRITREAFYKLYRVDDDETADAAPGERTAQVMDQAAYLWQKLVLLRKHYAEAARRGEAMLVRIGERPWDEDSPDSMR